MKLFASRTSPFARKARAVAGDKGIALEVEHVPLPYTAVAPLNPLGKIPVLVRDDGSVVFDSAVIVEYLDGLAPPSLLGVGEARVEIGIWHALGDGIMEAAIAWMLESRRPADKQMPARAAHQQSKIERAFDYAEARVGDGFLVGDAFSLADIALCCAIGYVELRHPHDWRSTRPRLAAYLARTDARPCLAATRPPAA
jgi:glutathione S-transferase